MKRTNGKLLTLCAAALLFYGCEKEEDLLKSASTENLVMEENCYTIDFESIAEGEYVNSISTPAGDVDVVGYAVNSADQLQTDQNRARIFDSENPTGDDDDLQTDDWGHVLIVQDIVDVSMGPNDNKWGAELILEFPQPVTLESMNVIDIDNGAPREGGDSNHPLESQSYVYLYTAGNATPVTIHLQPMGDNVGYNVDLLGTENVVRMVVDFDGPGAVGSGAIDDIRFCWSEEEYGCTRTQGYWKTHSGVDNGKGKGKGKGSSKFDAVWTNYLNKELGDLGKYPDILWMEPKGGDADIILAHQFIAAELNVAAGASIPGDVLEVWLLARGYFNGTLGYEPTRAELIEWAEILDRYNNGLLGPDHCD